MPRSLRLLLASLTLAGSACASAPKAQSDESTTTNAAAPQLLSRTSPELRAPVSSSGRAEFRIAIEVMVDATGKPDLSTLKVSGPGATENKDAIERWVAAASFRPGVSDGHPVPGLYRQVFEPRRVRR